MAERILIIDDSVTIQKVIRIALARFDFEIEISSNYLEAFAVVNQNPPHVIIADSALSGFKTPKDYRKLTIEAKGAPIILLVGTYDKVDEEAFRKEGFEWFIKKPFESDDIVEIVRNVLNREGGLEDKGTVTLTSSNENKNNDLGLNREVDKASDSSPKKQVGGSMEVDLGTLPPPPEGVSSGSFDLDEKTSPTGSLPPIPDFSDDSFLSKEADYKEKSDGYYDEKQNQNTKDDEKIDLLTKGMDLPPLPTFSLEQDEGGLESDALDFGAKEKAKEIIGDLDALKDSEIGRGVVEEGVVEREKVSNIEDVRRGVEQVDLKEVVKEVLTDRIEPIIREVVEEYCSHHFTTVARDIITAEIRRLTDEKARHLVDN